MLKIITLAFGLVMLAIGIMGFIPDYTINNKLFGLFLVNFWNNVIHISTGVIALMCGLSSTSASKIFFILFGLVFASIAVLGFMQGDGLLLGFVATNFWDNCLHTVIALIALYVGLFVKSRHGH